MLMDRANLVHMALRRVILAAVLLQATTPDLLDLSLLSQSLPPGPILALANLVVPRRALHHAGPLPRVDRSPFDAHSRSTLQSQDANPDDLCEPFWPELGVMRKRGTGAERCAGACLAGEPTVRSFVSFCQGRQAFDPKPASPPDVRFRLTC